MVYFNVECDITVKNVFITMINSVHLLHEIITIKSFDEISVHEQVQHKDWLGI